MNVHGDNDIRLTEIHTAELLVPELSAFEVEMAIEKLKRHKTPGTDKIPAELIKAAGKHTVLEIHKLINSTWNKEELSEQWKEAVIVRNYKNGDKTDITLVNCIQNSIKHPSVNVNSICRENY